MEHQVHTLRPHPCPLLQGYKEMERQMILRRGLIRRQMARGKALEPALFFPLPSSKPSAARMTVPAHENS